MPFLSIPVHSGFIAVDSCAIAVDSSGMDPFLQESVGHGEVLILDHSLVLHRIVSILSLKDRDEPHSRSPGKTINTPAVMATDIPSNILLFKTITMPLTQIPSTEPVTSIDYLENKIVDRSSN